VLLNIFASSCTSRMRVPRDKFVQVVRSISASCARFWCEQFANNSCKFLARMIAQYRDSKSLFTRSIMRVVYDQFICESCTSLCVTAIAFSHGASRVACVCGLLQRKAGHILLVILAVWPGSLQTVHESARVVRDQFLCGLCTSLCGYCTIGFANHVRSISSRAMCC
jgi:hypothetical protein